MKIGDDWGMLCEWRCCGLEDGSQVLPHTESHTLLLIPNSISNVKLLVILDNLSIFHSNSYIERTIP